MNNVYIFFCGGCSVPLPNEEEITEDLECTCANCGEHVTAIAGRFTEKDANTFWSAYNSI